jgi:hypothetical protein
MSLVMYTIYESPRDHPGKFVVRRFVVTGEGAEATAEVHVRDTLRQARLAVPGGLACIPRDPYDEAQIVETWL